MESKLDIKAIGIELVKLGRNWTWLANRLKILPSSMDYIKKVRPISKAVPIARVLRVDVSDIVA